MAVSLFSLRTWLKIHGALLVLLCVVALEWRALPNGKLRLSVLDVGQGDAIFIETPSGKQILMDAGPDFSVLPQLAERMPKTDRSIDLLILSHPHLDHLAAFPEIIRRYEIGAVLLAGMQYPGERYAEMLDEMAKRRIPIIVADPAKDLDMGDGVVLDVLWPKPIYFGKQANDDDVNNTSVALRVLYKDQSVVLTGDMEEEEESKILRSGADVRGTVLKVAHHGSKTSTSTGFLLAVRPQLAIISAGRDNKFRHPSVEILDRLKHFHIPVRITKDDGSIDLEW